ncbi:MAG: CGNR zinc finger domain-containing protein [Cognatishimia sp.]|uniref:CGNR zinc finger domain-containing protein n=1 Tax=Cognatishimia sp. TaxID=2211648 RepID=UPI003B8CFB6E
MIFIELINSEHIHGPDHVDDHLDKAEWLYEALKAWGFEIRDIAPWVGPLRELRIVLRAAVAELMEFGQLNEANISQLNSFLGPITYRYRVDLDAEGKTALRGTFEDQSPTHVIALGFCRYLENEDMKRLKLCENTRCREAFIDPTRNKSKKWCASNACGNLTKVRAFRARKAVQVKNEKS